MDAGPGLWTLPETVDCARCWCTFLSFTGHGEGGGGGRRARGWESLLVAWAAVSFGAREGSKREERERERVEMSFEPFGAWGERGDGRKESAFNEIDNDRSIRSFDGIVLHLWEEEKGHARSDSKSNR